MDTTRKIAAAALLLLAGAFAPSHAEAGGKWYGGVHKHHGPRLHFGWSHTPHVYRPAYQSSPIPWTATWFAYCRAKYRSFDPRSGTFLGYDGRRHFCR